jgi:putative SOS response-associated peptidase YedK
MCGRFTNQYSWRELVELYRITEPYLGAALNLEPRYNFAPQQRGVVIRLDREGRREPVMMRWGLVPSWAKDDKGGAKMINAKAETVAEKPAYRSAFLRRRCLVVSDGFYEWTKLTPREKQAWFITTRDHTPFAFAGLYEWWRPRDGSDILETFTIVTTTPNALCAPIHDRMPVMLALEDWAVWLGEQQAMPSRLQQLLKPFPAERMACRKVGKAVGNVQNEGPELIARAAGEE